MGQKYIGFKSMEFDNKMERISPDLYHKCFGCPIRKTCPSSYGFGDEESGCGTNEHGVIRDEYTRGLHITAFADTY